MRTKLWFVQLINNPSSREGGGWYCLRVGLEPATVGVLHTVKFRSITARAAVRKYIRNNLATQLYLMDDGSNEPADLMQPTSHNNGQHRQYRKGARKSAIPRKGASSLMAPGRGPDGYKVIFS